MPEKQLLQKIIIIAAPSGSGKTTIVRNIISKYDVFGFSVSCTTRPSRINETHGSDYYFISEAEFLKRIDSEDFLEWENVYQGLYYGTLKSEIERIHNAGKWPLLDIDVEGAVNLKEKYTDSVISIFIKPPSIQELENRLIKRGTDSEEAIQKRMRKAEYEMGFSSKFDHVVVNEDLERAIQEVVAILKNEGIIVSR